jgi:hypothetical protein
MVYEEEDVVMKRLWFVRLARRLKKFKRRNGRKTGAMTRVHV